jgi:putative ABC transport system permease protein
VAGRYLTAEDRTTLHCVISKGIAEEHQCTVGDTLKVDGKLLEIVGIYDTKSLFLDVAIIIDIALAREMGKVGADTVCNFYVEPQAAVRYADIADRINALLANRGPGAWQPTLDQALDLAGDNPALKSLAPLAKAALAAGGESKPPQTSPGEAPIEIRSPEDWSDQVQQFTADLDLFLAIMTTIGITIAFVGIVNTMLMSVSERIIEFGILKANGWSSGNVLTLIGCESALLGLGGGVLGAFVGWVATHAVNARFPTRIHLYASPKLLVASLLFSCVLGMLAGLYPALRAARMAPMEAIRRG